MNKASKARPKAMPLVLHFGRRMSEPAPLLLFRYNTAKQQSQVLFDGDWTDITDTRIIEFAATRITEIKRETTDDE